MVLNAGTRLGPYEIVDQLGAGGMGISPVTRGIYHQMVIASSWWRTPPKTSL